MSESRYRYSDIAREQLERTASFYATADGFSSSGYDPQAFLFGAVQSPEDMHDSVSLKEQKVLFDKYQLNKKRI